MLQRDIESINFPLQNETMVCKGFIQTHDNKMEKMYVEDLAALDPLSDDALVNELKNRLKQGESYSFIGDVLLSINPNKSYPAYDRKVLKMLEVASKIFQADHFSSTTVTCLKRVPTTLHTSSPLPTALIRTCCTMKNSNSSCSPVKLILVKLRTHVCVSSTWRWWAKEMQESSNGFTAPCRPSRRWHTPGQFSITIRLAAQCRCKWHSERLESFPAWFSGFSCWRKFEFRRPTCKKV